MVAANCSRGLVGAENSVEVVGVDAHMAEEASEMEEEVMVEVEMEVEVMVGAEVGK